MKPSLPDQTSPQLLSDIRQLIEASRAGLPPKALLQQKLHDAIARSRQRVENRGEEA